MKKIFKFSILIIFALALFSCSKIDEKGKWSDNIHLSTKAAAFNAAGDSVTVTTGGSWWWVSSVGVINPGVDTTWYYDFKGVNQGVSPYSIKQACFDLERLDLHTLFIKVDANPNHAKRIISITLQAGDYGDGITITQDGAK
jgi:hypothetical protein